MSAESRKLTGGSLLYIIPQSIRLRRALITLFDRPAVNCGPQGEADWTIYWFMFPVSIRVATGAMLTGIGGAAMFIPIFIVVFPLLGPEYPLPVAASIGSALITAVFGFSSGFVAYYRKGLIDIRSALPFILVAVPVSILGALLLAVLKEQETLLKSASFTKIASLIAAGGINAIPWNLACYTIPAIIVGGQIGPRLQGKIVQRPLEIAMALLFGLIGLAMTWIVVR